MIRLSKISNYWWCQIAGWGFVALSYVFFGYTFDEFSDINFLKLLLLVSSGLISTHMLRYVIKQLNWLLLPLEKVIPRFLAAIAVTSLFCSLLYILLVFGTSSLLIWGDVSFAWEGWGTLGEALRSSLFSSSILDFITRILLRTMDQGLFIAPWVLIYFFYHYIEKSRKQQLDTLKLEALVKELELKTIKSHINPHFIFNALNSIRALIDENPSRARDAITELSNILRSSMQAEKLETVPFERELNIVKDYLALEHIRFEDRLRVEYEIDEDTLDQPVPPMMLQTLVENAIKHGVSKQIKGGVVKVISDFKGDHHELIIQNTGHLNGNINSDGFGLSSTRNRLHLLFGEKANFEIRETAGNLVEARVLIPVEFK